MRIMSHCIMITTWDEYHLSLMGITENPWLLFIGNPKKKRQDSQADFVIKLSWQSQPSTIPTWGLSSEKCDAPPVGHLSRTSQLQKNCVCFMRFPCWQLHHPWFPPTLPRRFPALPRHILVGGAITISKKLKVNGKDDIPYIIEKKKCLKPPTSILPWCSHVFSMISQAPWFFFQPFICHDPCSCCRSCCRLCGATAPSASRSAALWPPLWPRLSPRGSRRTSERAATSGGLTLLPNILYKARNLGDISWKCFWKFMEVWMMMKNGPYPLVNFHILVWKDPPCWMGKSTN